MELGAGKTLGGFMKVMWSAIDSGNIIITKRINKIRYYDKKRVDESNIINRQYGLPLERYSNYSETKDIKKRFKNR